MRNKKTKFDPDELEYAKATIRQCYEDDSLVLGQGLSEENILDLEETLSAKGIDIYKIAALNSRLWDSVSEIRKKFNLELSSTQDLNAFLKNFGNEFESGLCYLLNDEENYALTDIGWLIVTRSSDRFQALKNEIEKYNKNVWDYLIKGIDCMA